jgi:hypothetical protein
MVDLSTGRRGKIGYNYTSIERAIDTRHRTLIHEMIDSMKAEGYTFGVESRRSKTGKIYNGYLYRQKRNVNGKREHLCLKARDLDDYRNNVLFEQAKREVFQDNLGGWADEGLTRSERKTFDTLIKECLRYRKQDDRNPVVQRYVKQLGLTVKNRRYGFINADSIPIERRKNILKAAQKALNKWDKSHRKLMKIIGIVLGPGCSSIDFSNFFKKLVKESKCRNNVKRLENYINRCREQGDNSPYSILEPSEVKPVAQEILWISMKSLNNIYGFPAQTYHKNEKIPYS